MTRRVSGADGGVCGGVSGADGGGAGCSGHGAVERSNHESMEFEQDSPSSTNQLLERSAARIV